MPYASAQIQINNRHKSEDTTDAFRKREEDIKIPAPLVKLGAASISLLFEMVRRRKCAQLEGMRRAAAARFALELFGLLDVSFKIKQSKADKSSTKIRSR